MPQEKYLATARLTDGVIYVSEVESWHAAFIIRQRTETVVDLFVVDPFGQTSLKLNVALGQSLDDVGRWVPKPKT